MRPSLAQVLSLFFLLLLGVLTGLLLLFDSGSRRSLQQAGDLLVEQTGSIVERQAYDFLQEAEELQIRFVQAVNQKAVDPDSQADLEKFFLQELGSHPSLGEVALTFAKGVPRNGELILEPQGKGQIAVYREQDKLSTRRIRQDESGFWAQQRIFPNGWSNPSNVPDPTKHLTFTTPAEFDNWEIPLWSDLHWSQRDATLPTSKRRVQVSVQKSIWAKERFLGVIRVGLRAEQLDQVVRNWGKHTTTPLQVFLSDSGGRIVTRPTNKDRIQELEDALRVDPKTVPAEVVQAAKNPGEKEEWRGRVSTPKGAFLAYLKRLRGSQDWWVGVVVSESYLLRDLQKTRNEVLAGSAVITILLLAAGATLATSIRKDLSHLVDETSKMEALSLDPSHERGRYKETQRVTDGLERAKEALRKSQQQSVFLANVSHELRTPLTSIIGYAGALKDGINGPLKAEQKDTVEVIQKNSKALLRMIDDLLDISKFEAGKLDLTLADFPIQDVLEYAYDTIRPQLEAKGLRFDPDIPEEAVWVKGDFDRLSQVFVNLLGNAVKFCDHGGVGIRLKPSENEARIEVWDTGPGISQQDLPKIFDEFTRGESKKEGSGLGLAICKRIVTLHKGKIEVESGPGGTTFIVNIPATNA